MKNHFLGTISSITLISFLANIFYVPFKIITDNNYNKVNADRK